MSSSDPVSLSLASCPQFFVLCVSRLPSHTFPDRLRFIPTPALGFIPTPAGAGSLVAVVEHCEEGLLGDLHAPDLLHPLLAFLLFLQELALAGDVAAVTLGGN